MTTRNFVVFLFAFTLSVPLLAAARPRPFRPLTCAVGMQAKLVVVDLDRDGYASSGPLTKCVSTFPFIWEGRTYVDPRVDPLGFTTGSNEPPYTLLLASDAFGAEDVDDGNHAVYAIVEGGTDRNHDGIIVETEAATFPVGDMIVVDGRRYYRGAEGTFNVLLKEDIKGFGDPSDQ